MGVRLIRQLVLAASAVTMLAGGVGVADAAPRVEYPGVGYDPTVDPADFSHDDRQSVPPVHAGQPVGVRRARQARR